jgi:hypothetical protein
MRGATFSLSKLLKVDSVCLLRKLAFILVYAFGEGLVANFMYAKF